MSLEIDKIYGDNGSYIWLMEKGKARVETNDMNFILNDTKNNYQYLELVGANWNKSAKDEDYNLTSRIYNFPSKYVKKVAKRLGISLK